MNRTMDATAHTVWSRPSLAAQALRRRRDGHVETLLRIPALCDPRRTLRLEQALTALPGVLRASPDVAARRLRIGFDDRRLDLPRLLDTCAAAGCPAEPLSARHLDNPRAREYADSLRHLLVAGVFAMQAMGFALVLYLDTAGTVDATTRQLFRWLGLLAATPVVGYAALPFYRHALASMRARRTGIDVPVAIAVLAIYAASAVSALRGEGEAYFDSVSMFVFVLLIGRHLELRARHRHRAASEAAADATPLVASRRRAEGTLECVAVAELEPGDRVQVPEGGVVPADGSVENAGVQLDESLLNGESRALPRRTGDTVAAGSLVLQGPLEMRVLRAAGDGAAARLADLAGNAVAPHDADRAESALAARRFVQRVLLFTLVTAAFWLWRDPTHAFDATIAVIVVACPCAFGLAAPAAHTRAMAVLARVGVMVSRPAALSGLNGAGRAMFDKTGTLTEPGIDHEHIEIRRGLDRDEACRLAAALARESLHPLSRAVAQLGGRQSLPCADAVESIAGGGLSGTVEGRQLRLGRAGFAFAGKDDDALWLADGDGILARFPVVERLREEAPATLSALRARGFEPVIASGDSAERVRAVAERLGIDAWHARQSPGDKLQRIAQWQATGGVALAIGDGGNDAPALAAADVSATLVGGADLARAHADLLLGHGLDGVVQACDTARCAHRVLRQNRRWSLAYNLAAVPFAAAGLVPPWLAAIGMSLSSLAVVLNSLRIGVESTTEAVP